MPPDSAHPSVRVALVVSDQATADALRPAGETLDALGIGWEQVMFPPCAPLPRLAEGTQVVITASGDALLPAALAERTGLPVVRVPVPEAGREGLPLIFDDGGNLPGGTGEAQAFATVAIGAAGAKNAALFAAATLALEDGGVRAAWEDFRARQTEAVLRHPAPGLDD